MTDTEQTAVADVPETVPPVLRLLRKIALCRAEIPALVKKKENTHHKSKYVNLAQVLDLLAEHLPKFNLLDTFEFEQERNGANDMIAVYRVFDLDTGEHISARLPMQLEGIQQKGAQATGSASTYAQRYLRCSFWAIPQEDDDGNAGSGATKPRSHQKKKPPQPAKTAEEVQEMLDKVGTMRQLESVRPHLAKLPEGPEKEMLKELGARIKREILENAQVGTERGGLPKGLEGDGSLGEIPL